MSQKKVNDMEYEKRNSLGWNYFQEGNIKKLFYGSLYLGLSRKGYYLDSLKYSIFRLREKRTNILKEIMVNNCRMYISLNDKGISNELYNLRKREHFATDFMYEFVNKDDTVIDIGANIGYYALLESQLITDGCIYAIEPIPSNFQILNENIQLNHCNNIASYQLAIGERNGTAKMYVYDRCNWCSFTKMKNLIAQQELDVETLTLDCFIREYMDRYPTFIRMDVEGFEYHIIRGASDILRKSKHLKLNIELHPHLMPEKNMKEILATLKENNFKIRAITVNPPTHIYKNMSTFNLLRKLLGLPEFGLIEGDYVDLERILETKICSPIVFFEKN
jgi:FkbM family methyltransferase